LEGFSLGCDRLKNHRPEAETEMTPEEVNEVTREVAREAAREAVREMMTTLGIDASNPAAIIETQKDFQFNRSLRLARNTVVRQTLITAVGLLVAGIAGLIYMHFRR
jgi:hypothetical protein